MIFICPICQEALRESGGAAVCPRGHSFDRAREGYYNLLLGQGAGTHGDNAEMVRARREFLSSGAYEPLARRVGELVSEYTVPSGLVLDVGCGEGYYTDIVYTALTARDPSARVSAFDISKDAARRAAKRNKNISVAVASAYRMPIASGSVDTVMNLFSPLAPDEVWRTLAGGGKFIIAFPAEEHLFGLKAAIYDTPYKNEPEDDALRGFKLLHRERMTYSMTLSAVLARELFMMTPYAYRTTERERERLFSLGELTTDADFYIFVYEKGEL
ncbi:MAG: methyltransferase domain-containing protein [Clostridia bacterium]|nr:methyltransferase domain-containing protein [Clostridia bacterium]